MDANMDPESFVKFVADTTQAHSKGSSQVFVAIVGVPGGGKTTAAKAVVKVLEERDGQGCAVHVPMDGFHYYRHELDRMPDPADAHRRRGAPWTFDSGRMLECLQRLKESGSGSLPNFEHSVKDPVEGAIVVGPGMRYILCEGNYLLLDQEVWRDIGELFDVTFFIDTDIGKAMHRVASRHQSEMELSASDAWQRIETNDQPNALLIQESASRATHRCNVVYSESTR
eukprot:comp22351_c0_seq1/m.33271 comp22351_c0_seq1/g.33271  ORF comp22351_c0_seq1/g.33271 comp22351_c0_seq1/m.33271 type:complete len:227 (-) comp22351_c0_seq1:703-1383(-)